MDSLRLVAGASGLAASAYDADVIILALDRLGETKAAIASALGQIGVSRHVWIIDQGSAPDTLTALAALAGGRTDATLLAAPRNLGVAGGRGLGSSLGHGRVIAAIDNDATLQHRSTWADAVAALDEDPRLAAVGFRILCADGIHDALTSWGYPRPLLARAADSFESVTFVGAGHAIRRTAWEAAGGYDAAPFFCWEEFDFCLRAIDQGWRVRYRGDIAVLHAVAAERRVAWNGERWFHFVRNRLYVARKWGASPGGLLPRYGAYILKGLRNGLLRQTLAAWPAASALASHAPPRTMSAVGRAYLQATDTLPRGSLMRRWRDEVFSRLSARPPGGDRQPSSRAIPPYAPSATRPPRAG